MKLVTRSRLLVLLAAGLAGGLLVAALGNAGTSTITFQAVAGPLTRFLSTESTDSATVALAGLDATPPGSTSLMPSPFRSNRGRNVLSIVAPSRLDDSFATRWAPRALARPWSGLDRARVSRLIESGRMTQAGIAALPPRMRVGLDQRRLR